MKALKGAFIEAMSLFASTVCVVTTDGPGGKAGLTATSVTSVSADTPAPTLLVCVNGAGPSNAAIKKNNSFCVNVLHTAQMKLADTFAGRHSSHEASKFRSADWIELQTGCPALIDAVAVFDCQVVHVQTVGWHDVFFAEVVEAYSRTTMETLIYSRRNYSGVMPFDHQTFFGAHSLPNVKNAV